MDRKYFVFDRGILQPQRMSGLRLRVCRAVKDTEYSPMFTEDFFADPPRRWEARFDNAYPNVIYDPKYEIYRCYYTLCSVDWDSASATREERAARDYVPRPDRITSLGYAESKDGFHWYKPSLGLVEFEGSRDNNLVFRYAHGTGIFLDEEERDPQKRYKLVTKVEYPGGPDYMAVNFSEDGIHWGPMLPWPKYNPPADSHNFPFRDRRDGKFRVITRTWQDGLRISSICESTDFRNWSEPKEIFRSVGFSSQIYSMPVWQYEGLYLGFASMFHEGNRTVPDFDTVDLELKYATDPAHFNSVAENEYVIERGVGHYPTGAFDCGCIYAAAPLLRDGRVRLYYMGGNGQHTNFRETSFGLAYLEPDKFACYEPETEESQAVLTTAAFHFYGEELWILAECTEAEDTKPKDTKPKGAKPRLRAALCDPRTGEPWEGFEQGTLAEEENGWWRLRFDRKLLSLGQRQASLSVKFEKCRIYAFGGELECASDRRKANA